MPEMSFKQKEAPLNPNSHNSVYAVPEKTQVSFHAKNSVSDLNRASYTENLDVKYDRDSLNRDDT